jgi:drug/metabolite transporter (DMT)-like permease
MGRMWLAALFWGFNWPAVRIMLDAASPWTLRAAGLAGGGAILLAAATLTGRSMTIPRDAWGRLAVASALNVFGFNVCSVFAQLSMPTSRAAILTFTMPLWAALFAWLFLAEQLDGRRRLSLALGALGIAVLAVPFWPVVQAGGLPWGLVYVIGAAVSWALGTVWMKAKPIAADPIAVTAWQVALAAAACTICMLLFETPRLDLSNPRVAAAFGYHILLPQCLAYVLWFSLLREIPASKAALGTLLIPIFGVAGSIMLLGDWPTPLDVIGLALILAAVANDQILRPAHVDKASVRAA